MTAWRLVADVGGTNVRLARAFGTALRHHHSYMVSRYPSFLNALKTYLTETGGAAGCAGAAICAAGPVQDGIVQLTNAPWIIDASEIARHMKAPVAVINDLEAVALSLPLLAEDELEPIGSLRSKRRNPRRMLAVNVGTGFGATTLIRAGDQWITCPGEPGHATFAATDATEWELLGAAASVEDILSGRGIVRLYCHLRGAPSEASGIPGAAEIFELAAGKDPYAKRTVEAFTRLLARVSGDLALAVAAWDGVFLCGSVAAGWCRNADTSVFRTIFEDKGAMTSRMRSIPTALVLKEDAALLGLASLSLPSHEKVTLS